MLQEERPERPRFQNLYNISRSIWSVVRACWAQRATDRPTADQLVKWFHLAALKDDTNRQALQLSLTATEDVFSALRLTETRDVLSWLSELSDEELQNLADSFEEVITLNPSGTRYSTDFYWIRSSQILSVIICAFFYSMIPDSFVRSSKKLYGLIETVCAQSLVNA